jgi:hypothetical protein
MKDNYLVVQGWMVSELNLSGNDLLTYALIYGFSQDGESEFTGSINYLCKWLNCSRPTAIKSLKFLTEKNLIIKNVNTINGVSFNRYKISLGIVKKVNVGSKETLLGGSKETLPNNTTINNTNNNIENETKEEYKINDIESIDYDVFLEFINTTFKREFQLINDNVKKKYKALLKQGYKKNQIKQAVINASKNDYHKQTNYQYCTPEYFSRAETIDKFSSISLINNDNVYIPNQELN